VEKPWTTLPFKLH